MRIGKNKYGTHNCNAKPTYFGGSASMMFASRITNSFNSTYWETCKENATRGHGKTIFLACGKKMPDDQWDKCKDWVNSKFPDAIRSISIIPYVNTVIMTYNTHYAKSRILKHSVLTLVRFYYRKYHGTLQKGEYNSKYEFRHKNAALAISRILQKSKKPIPEKTLAFRKLVTKVRQKGKYGYGLRGPCDFARLTKKFGMKPRV